MHKHITATHLKIKVIKLVKVKSDKLMLKTQSILVIILLNNLIKKISIVKSITIDYIKINKSL